MIAAILTASRLDFDGWLRGLFSAGISSFAGALGSSFGPAMIDPKDFNLQSPLLMFKAALVGAFISGTVSMAKFLSAQPLPAVKQVETTIQTVTPSPGAPPKVTETVKETRTEPVRPQE